MSRERNNLAQLHLLSDATFQFRTDEVKACSEGRLHEVKVFRNLKSWPGLDRVNNFFCSFADSTSGSFLSIEHGVTIFSSFLSRNFTIFLCISIYILTHKEHAMVVAFAQNYRAIDFVSVLTRPWHGVGFPSKNIAHLQLIFVPLSCRWSIICTNIPPVNSNTVCVTREGFW